MPYYVFAIKPFGQLDKLGEHAAFKPASLQAKALRAAQPSGALRIKVMFGETQLAAEDQLLQLREAGPSGDE
jgi:hypothetical protein